MRTLIAFPTLAFLIVVQSAVVSRLPLLAGYADILLVFLVVLGLQEGVDIWPWAVIGGLLAGFVSAVPWPVVLGGYLLVGGLAWLLRQRVWEAPLLAAFIVIFFGTLMVHILTFVALRLLGSPAGFVETLEQITLPSLLLNLFFSVVMYPFARDLARWVYPVEELV